MGSFGNQMITGNLTTSSNVNHQHRQFHQHTTVRSSWHRHEEEKQLPQYSQSQPASSMLHRRSGLVSAMVMGATAMLEARRPAHVEAAEDQMRWGTHSFIKEKYFQPQLSPEDSVARIRQTTEGLREMRHMLDTMSWRYVMFYIRLKSAYLDSDLKNALSTLPPSLRKSYIKAANDVVDNMSELDRHVRSPKVYESYLYYEKTLKSLDELVAMLA